MTTPRPNPTPTEPPRSDNTMIYAIIAIIVIVIILVALFRPGNDPDDGGLATTVATDVLDSTPTAADLATSTAADAVGTDDDPTAEAPATETEADEATEPTEEPTSGG